MNVLLLFFALPIATIIISIALQKIFKSPALVAAIIFAIFLVITFFVNNINFLIATIVYTIISYITAVIVCIVTKIIRKLEERDRDCNCCRRYNNNCDCNNTANELLTINSTCGNREDGNLLTISSNCSNGRDNDLLTISSNMENSCDNNNNCNNVGSNGITARINVIPNSNNNGRTGCLCGRYRRR